MPQPLTNEDVLAAVLTMLQKQQAEAELRRQKGDADRQKLAESIAALEKWKGEAGKAGAMATGQRLDDGTLEVSVAGKSFRISSDGRFLA